MAEKNPWALLAQQMMTEQSTPKTASPEQVGLMQAKAAAQQPTQSLQDIMTGRVTKAMAEHDNAPIEVAPWADELRRDVNDVVAGRGDLVKQRNKEWVEGGVKEIENFFKGVSKSIETKYEEAEPVVKNTIKEIYGATSTLYQSAMGREKGDATALVVTDALSSPPPQLSKGEQAQATREIAETQEEIDQAANDQSMWTKVLTGFGYPEKIANAMWDGVTNPVDTASGIASAVGSGVSAVNDRVDILTMLATAAAVGSQRGSNVAMAVAQGLGAGVTAAANKRASITAAQEEKMRWEKETQIKLMNAQTTRSKEIREMKSLTSTELDQAPAYAETLGVAEGDVQSAMTMLKANGTPITIDALKKALIASGVEDKWFGKATSGKLM